MGLKFRKRIRVFPGFYLNLSKSGLSATVGMKGFNVNLGKNGAYLNTGIPGTGIYDRVKINNKSNESHTNYNEKPTSVNIIDDKVEIKSYTPELISSDGLFGLKEAILNAQKVKIELKNECESLKKEVFFAKIKLIFSYLWIIGFFIKYFKNNFNEITNQYKESIETYKNFKLNIDFNMDESILKEYNDLKENFEQIRKIDSIWDVTSSQNIDKAKERSAAGTNITRNKVSFYKNTLDFIDTPYQALTLQNSNGGDLFMYPGFIVMTNKLNNDFGLIDFRDLKFESCAQKFLETERVPKDTKIINKTWKYVNKNGQPDKRFKDNYEIPIVLYWELTLKSSKGLFESYSFSNPEIGEIFCKSLESYQNSLNNMKWEKEDLIEIEKQ